jgi:hypothetical protein
MVRRLLAVFMLAVISTSSLTFSKDDTPTCPVELAKGHSSVCKKLYA